VRRSRTLARDTVNSKREAIKWALLAGMCQPVGALVFGMTFSQHLTPYALSCALSSGPSLSLSSHSLTAQRSRFVSLRLAVAGIMALLCVQELIPTCLRHLNLWVRRERERGCVCTHS
jgi:zinc transporter ZupT